MFIMISGAVFPHQIFKEQGGSLVYSLPCVFVTNCGFLHTPITVALTSFFSQKKFRSLMCNFDSGIVKIILIGRLQNATRLYIGS